VKVKDYLKKIESKISNSNELKIDILEKINNDFEDKKEEEFKYDEWIEYLEEIDEDGHMYEIVDAAIGCSNYSLRVWAVDNYIWIREAMEDLCNGETDFHKIIMSGQFVYYSSMKDEIIELLKNEY